MDANEYNNNLLRMLLKCKGDASWRSFDMAIAPQARVARLKKDLHDHYGLQFIPEDTFHHRKRESRGEKYEFLASRYEYIPTTGAFRKVGRGLPSKGHLAAGGYRQIGCYCPSAGKVVSAPAHRLAWFMFHGELPTGHVDHIDNDRENNSIDNLRVVTHAQNMRNRKDSTNSPGVSRIGRTAKFKAQINNGGKTKRLGVFDDFQSAKRARYKAEALLDSGRWDDVVDVKPLPRAKSGDTGIRVKGDRHRVLLGCTRREQRNGMKANVHIGMYSDRETALLARDICYKLREMGCNPKTGEPLFFD